MAKQITPRELAEVVSTLLVKPTLLGELEQTERYMQFMEAIGGVVADFCGGMVNGVGLPFGVDVDLSDVDGAPYLSIDPSDCLPSLNRNVWSIFDTEGWEGYAPVEGIPLLEPMNSSEVETLRSQMQRVLLPPVTVSSLCSKLLVDCEIQDWRVSEQVDLPLEQQDTFRFEITQVNQTKQVFFKLYSKNLDLIADTMPQIGLAGVIEVRNGRPAISIGVCEDNIGVHVESNGINGVFIHVDKGVDVTRGYWHSSSHNMDFEGLSYQISEEDWIGEARSDIANQIFDSHVFSDGRTVADTGGWEIDDCHFKKTVFFENPNGDSIKGYFHMDFAPDSVQILSVREG
jgi:hypothetical protein